MATSESHIPDVATPARRQPRNFLRISLLSFLLTVTLICVSIACFRVVRERSELKQKNDQLMSEIGYLVIHDPTKVYVREIDSLDQLTWRFRIYLPPKKKYLLNTNASRRSWEGTPIGHDEQFTLTVALRRNDNGEWKYKMRMPLHSCSGPADVEIAEGLAGIGYPVGIGGNQKELDPDTPFDLVQLLNGNFRVWIEPKHDLTSPVNRTSTN